MDQLKVEMAGSEKETTEMNQIEWFKLILNEIRIGSKKLEQQFESRSKKVEQQLESYLKRVEENQVEIIKKMKTTQSVLEKKIESGQTELREELAMIRVELSEKFNEEQKQLRGKVPSVLTGVEGTRKIL